MFNLTDIPGEWVRDARCSPHVGDYFFPDSRTDNPGPALEFCKACPVQAPCLEFTLASDKPEAGIAGGMTEQQRRRLLGLPVRQKGGAA